MKQTAAIQDRIANDLHEMSKPLTRTADDVDLDDHLKNVERQEDPMLQYIKKKKIKAGGGPSKFVKNDKNFISILFSI